MKEHLLKDDSKRKIEVDIHLLADVFCEYFAWNIVRSQEVLGHLDFAT